MPFVVAHIAKGRPLEKRRRLAAAITDAITEIFEIERGATQVVILEHERDSWAIGGELLSERTPAKGPEFDLDSLFRKPAAKPPAKSSPKAAPRKPAAKPRSRR
jgi:4-oxalocrotonate tautomerase